MIRRRYAIDADVSLRHAAAMMLLPCRHASLPCRHADAADLLLLRHAADAASAADRFFTPLIAIHTLVTLSMMRYAATRHDRCQRFTLR